MVARGDAWFYSGGACIVLFRGGVHGFIRGKGVCVVLFGGGHAWFYLGACMVLFGGTCVVLFGGHAWFYSGGACVVFSVFSDTMRYGQ